MADKNKNVSESSESRNHVDESPLSTLFSNDTCYDMSHKNKGKVIVFNDSSSGALKFWNGTFKNDVEAIKNTFGKKLGFDVKVYNDLSLWDIREKVEELQQVDYSEDNCLVIFLLAPAAGYRYLKAQEEVYSVKSIWKQFTGDKCPSLAGKPKLFFIQASKEIAAGIVGNMGEVQMFINYKIASYADFLIGHNSFDDYGFLPRVQKSSFYIQHLCDILDANSHKYDLLSIMATVTKEVGSDNWPIPSTLSTLRKKVYFNRQRILKESDEAFRPAGLQEDQILFIDDSPTTNRTFDRPDGRPISESEVFVDDVPLSPDTPNALSTSFSNGTCYDMGHKNQGNVIVINHFQIEGEENREGTCVDVQRIQNTFGNLGFNVKVYNDSTLSEIRRIIDDLSQADYTDDNCLVIIILTHGENNGLLKSKDGEVYSLETIWKKFTGDKCPNLAGKPKLFFVQACRGAKFDSGVNIRIRRESQTFKDSSYEISYKIPSHADFLIGNSSFEDYVSWRNGEEGSWYIKCLCEVLDADSDKYDLTSMMTTVARKVGQFRSVSDKSYEHDKVQIPTVLSTLTRKIYFKPQTTSVFDNVPKKYPANVPK